MLLSPIVYIALAILAVVLLWGIWIYNRFVRLKNFLREAWSGIDVQLRRRYDLIPNLVEAVKGYSGHEQVVFTEVAASRTRAQGASGVGQQAHAETDLTRQLRGIFALVENYPDLKASQNFLDLQKNLTAVEDEIQMARRYYNGTARNYNILVQSLPSRLIAALGKFEPAEFFEIELATVREAPEVDLAPRATAS